RTRRQAARGSGVHILGQVESLNLYKACINGHIGYLSRNHVQQTPRLQQAFSRRSPSPSPSTAPSTAPQTASSSRANGSACSGRVRTERRLTRAVEFFDRRANRTGKNTYPGETVGVINQRGPFYCVYYRGHYGFVHMSAVQGSGVTQAGTCVNCGEQGT